MNSHCLRIIAFVWGEASSVHAQQEHDSLENYIGDIEKIKADPRHNYQDSSAIKQLILDAELAMNLDTFSVVDNSPVPPSGTKNDYFSWAPY